MKTSRPLQARENVGDQVVIGLLYASDWLRRWHEFSRHDPIPDDFRHNWNCFNLDFVLQTDETPQGKRKKKAKKDADAPKRPMSGYMLWLSEIREQIKGENPGISVTELSKVAGEKWKKIEDKTVNDLCIPYISIMREWWLCKDFYSTMCTSSRRSTTLWPTIEQFTIFEGYFCSCPQFRIKAKPQNKVLFNQSKFSAFSVIHFL